MAATALVVGVLALAPPTAHAAGAAITVGNGITTTDLNAVGMSPSTLASSLVGSGVTVSNVTYTGANPQAGALHVVDPAVVSFNDGIILSSGNVADVVGPNKSDGITGDMGGGADPQLDALIANTQTVNPVTFDAASLEFDFVPAASHVYFTYTFASDEYLEWVNLFNDVFAFYVNGQNCAVTPGGDPVSIDTINSAVNPNLFRDNSFSSPPANPINIESDGLSVEMICSAPVNAGQTNHMKLAIADTSDQILDSVVMIKANSLSTVKPESCNDGVDNNDDTKVDMEDATCQATTTPPPTGGSGIGSSGNAPAFTGNEGTPIPLDASALDWTPSVDTVNTTWTVTGINGTPGTCDVSPAGPQPLNLDGTVAVVTAVCPNEGEYVARVDGWDNEGGAAWDTDVDFFVHNAPPAVTIDAPTAGSQTDTATPVDVSATVTDPGVNDTVTCSIDWGDGTSEAGVLAAGTCTGSHTYAAIGSKVISVTATDDAGDSSASATVVDVTTPVIPNTPPTAAAGGPYSGAEGSPIALNGSADDADGDPLTTAWTVTPDAAGVTCTVADPSALSTTVTCNDDTTFTAQLVADDGIDTGSDSTTGTVANAAPTVAITSPASGSSVFTGATVDVSSTIVDASELDTFTCSIDWGDGTPAAVGVVAGNQCTGSHAFATTGTRTITVTATDDNGGVGSATTSVSAIAAAKPTISSFSPSSGPVGTTVTITGTNLTGATAVAFHGTSAGFVVNSATKITALVPAGATTGTISVTTPGGTATSTKKFTVSVPPAPSISSFSPSSGPVGTSVTITGKNFTGATAVRFNTTSATTYTVVSATSIVATVPAGATTGKITVVTPSGSTSSKSRFAVL